MARYYSPLDMFDLLLEPETKPMAYVPSNIYETDSHFHIELELPGVDKENISVKLEDKELLVKVTKNSVEPEDAKRYYKNERYFGTIEKRYVVEDEIGETDARYENGILYIALEKIDKINKKEIEVK